MSTWQYILAAVIIVVGVVVAYLYGRYAYRQKVFVCLLAFLSVDAMKAFFEAAGVKENEKIDEKIAVLDYIKTGIKFFEKEKIL